MLLLSVPLFAAGLIFTQRLVKKRLVAELNKQLTVKVLLHSVDISGLSDFPNIGVRFNNLRVDQSAEYYDGHLLRARTISVVVNAWDLIRGKNTINKLQISNGEMQIYEGLVGNNYSIFKSDTSNTSSTSETKFNIDLKKVELNNMRLIYKSRKTKQNVNCYVEHTKARLKYSDEHVSLGIKGYTIFDHYEAEGTEYLLGKKIAMDVDLDINQKINSYSIHKGKLEIDGLPLSLSGSALLTENANNLDLKFETKKADMKGLLALLPPEMVLPLRDWNTSGNLSITGTAKGVISATKFPVVDIDFAIQSGTVINEKYDLQLGQIKLDGKLSNNGKPKLDALGLSVKLHQFSTPKSDLAGSINVESFSNPNTDFALTGQLYLSDIEPLLGDLNIHQGKVKLNTKGTLSWSSYLQNFDYNRSTFFGDLSVVGLDMNIDDISLQDIQARGKLIGRNWEETQVKGSVQNSDFDFKGTIADWPAGLLGNSTKRGRLEGKLDVQAFDLNAFLSENQEDAKQVSEANAKSVWTGEKLLDIGWDAKLHITTASFTYDEMKFSAIDGTVFLDELSIKIPKLELEGMDGKAKISTQFVQEKDKIAWSGNFYLDHLQMDEFFRQFDNFGQTEITHQHLSGRLTTETDLYALFDHEWNIISEEIIVLSKLNVKDGELKGYKPLESLSSFVEVEDLKHIRFSEMKNVIRIEDETIFIPSMVIKNNALNLELSGTHTFENELDYKLKLSLTELLAKKSGWIKTRKQKQLESGQGGAMNAYILLSGTPDDLQIKFDKKAVKNKVKADAKAETKQFFKNLKKEIRGERIEEEDDDNPWDE